MTPMTSGRRNKLRLQSLANTAVKTVKSNSPAILTTIGVAGLFSTSYLIAKASFEAQTIISMNEDAGGVANNPRERFKERTKQVWRLYIPAGISGAVTVACIVGSSRVSASRVSAAATAYSLSDLAFSEYKEKVVEQLGKNKEQAIRDEIAQEKVAATPSGQAQLFVVAGGQVLCCELYTRRYFRSDMETLRRIQNDINHLIHNEPYVTLDEFYDLLGLPHTSHSGEMGWDADKKLELEFSTVLSDANEPCLAFEYNYIKPLN